MGRMVQYAVCLSNFVWTTVAFFMYFSEAWITNETAGEVNKQQRFYKGLWQECLTRTEYSRVCDYYDASVIFNRDFARNNRWILVCRIVLFLAMVIGLAANFAFLLGSDISTMYYKHLDKKRQLKRVGAIISVVAAGLMLFSGLWAFIFVLQHYNDATIISFQGGDNSNLLFIAGSATYTQIIGGCFWLVSGLMALFCTSLKDHSY